MNKSMILVSAISAVLFAAPVYATDDDDHDHDSNVTTPVVTNPNSVVNNNLLNSSLTNTSVVDNVNRNRNDVNSTNSNNLSQNQTQAQQQNQQQTANATGGSSNATGGNATATGNGSGNSTSITQNYRDYRPTVNSAYSGSLTSGLDTCLGSVSAGMQTQIVGLSGGKTVVDKNCVLIKQVQLLVQLGYPTAACFRARQDSEIDEAMKAAGIECVELPAVPAVVNSEDPSHPTFDVKSVYK